MRDSRNKLKVVVIGAGNMGSNHIRNYKLLPQVDLLALADINPETKQLADKNDLFHYTDYKKMLEELNPDAVSIVVPTPLHALIGEETIKRGIHTFIEKPIASTVKEADELIALAKKQKIIFTVGHIEHFNPLVLKLHELISKNKLGEITSVVCKRVGDFPKNEPKTDVIIDLAVHDIGIISFLLGKQPRHIYSHASRTVHPHKVDAAEILMDYGTASGFIQANWTTPVKVRNISVTGTNGYVEGNYLTQELIYYEHNLDRAAKNYSELVSKGEPRQEIIPVNFQEPLIVELGTFINAIRTGDKTHLVQPEDARSALDVALRAVKKWEV